MGNHQVHGQPERDPHASTGPVGNRPANNARLATPGSVVDHLPQGQGEAADFLGLNQELGAAPPPPVALAPAAPLAAPQPVAAPSESAEAAGASWLFQTQEPETVVAPVVDETPAEPSPEPVPEIEYHEPERPARRLKPAMLFAGAAAVVGMIGFATWSAFRASQSTTSDDLPPSVVDASAVPQPTKLAEPAPTAASRYPGRRSVATGEPVPEVAFAELAPSEPKPTPDEAQAGFGVASEPVFDANADAVAADSPPPTQWLDSGATEPGVDDAFVSEDAGELPPLDEEVDSYDEVPDVDVGADATGARSSISTWFATDSGGLVDESECPEPVVATDGEPAPFVNEVEPVPSVAILTPAIAVEPEPVEVVEIDGFDGSDEVEAAGGDSDGVETAVVETDAALRPAPESVVAVAPDANPESVVVVTAPVEPAVVPPFAVEPLAVEPAAAAPVVTEPLALSGSWGGWSLIDSPLPNRWLDQAPALGVATLDLASELEATPAASEPSGPGEPGARGDVAQAPSKPSTVPEKPAVAPEKPVAHASTSKPGDTTPPTPVATTGAEGSQKVEIPSASPTAVAHAAKSTPAQPEKTTDAGGLRRASAQDLSGIWTDSAIPFDSIAGDKRMLTPSVGRVRVLLVEKQVLEGLLYSVGQNQVTINTDLGRIGVAADRIQKIERIDVAKVDPSKDAASDVRIKTPGGIVVGKVVSTEGGQTVVQTKDGSRVTFASKDVQVQTGSKVAIKP
ncbi:MAG: hypothetical protein HZA52_21615 [Planctomycetes bacterium]|nr:hypothetical protein [Planctomycetota bacterium]